MKFLTFPRPFHFNISFVYPLFCYYPIFIWAILADFRVILSTDSRLLSLAIGRLGVGRLAALRR